MDTENRYIRYFGVLIAAFMMIEFSLDSFFSGIVVNNPEVSLGFLAVLGSSIGLVTGLSSGQIELKKLEKYAVVGLASSFILYGYVNIAVVNPGNIGSDGVHFMKQSAEMVLNGENPYGHTFEQKPSPMYFTPTFDGSTVDQLLYPGGSFLSYIPFLLLGIDIRFIGVLLLLAAAGIIYRVSPDEFGVLPVLILGVSRHFLTSATIDIDMLWVNLVIGSLLFFQERNKLSAVLFGLASSVKPTPWIIAPFILLHFYKTEELRSKGAEFVAYSVGIFTAINLPFILSKPVPWFTQVFNLPLKFLGIGNTEIFIGQGLSILSFTGLLNLSLGFYSLAALTSVFVLGYAYLVYFEDMKHWFWMFPMIIYFFTYRGMGKYYMMFMPIAAAVLIKRYYIEKGDLGEFKERISF